MTIKELKMQLNDFDDNMDVFVALFRNDNTASIFDIASISDNNGHMQIDIEENEYAD